MIERLLPRMDLSQGWVVRLALLMAQSFCLGITLSLLIISSNSIFLTEFGAQVLPYVYITVAVTGSLLFYRFSALQRRWALPQLAMMTLAFLAIFYLLSWGGMVFAQLRWLSFALLVSFSLLIQIGFIFLGGQAGRLLDLQQIKRLFPQVVAGFVVGFMVGALLFPSLIALLGGTENVLLAVVATTLLWLVFLWITNRRFFAELNRVEAGSQRQPAQPLTQLMKNRYVWLIFVYMMLAAMVGQLSDFILLAQAGQRYATTDGLAKFFSVFTVTLNSTDLLFTTLIAGFFLSRFGLKAGLLANSLVMSLLLLAMALVAPSSGLASGLFFGLVVAARIANITLTDGTTRSATNAAYQALPAHERGSVQTGVEGVGAPLALGLVGVILLLFNAIPGLSLIHIVWLALLIALAWIAVSLLVYREYKGSLVAIIRRQTLGEADLDLEDPATLAAIDRLLHSARTQDVRLALESLQGVGHPSFESHLLRLLAHPDPAIREDVLARIEAHRLLSAIPAVEDRVRIENEPAVKGAALRTIAALKEGEAIEQLIPFLDDPHGAVRLGAAVGLLRYGGIPGVLAAGTRLSALDASPDPDQRIFAAEAIGAVGSQSFYQPLLSLLADDLPEVRLAALGAASQVRHPRLLDAILANLARPGTRSAAIGALVAYRDAILPTVKDALEGNTSLEKDQVLRLVRACGQVGGSGAISALKAHVRHPEAPIRQQVLSALSLCRYRPESADLPLIEQALHDEVEGGLRLLVTRDELGEEEALLPLQRALDEEYSQVCRRIFLLLSFPYESQVILQAEERLLSGSDSEKALVTEILEVTLSSAHKASLLPLVDPRRSLKQRLGQSGKGQLAPRRSRDERLQEVIAGANGDWRAGWIQACAIYAAARLGSRGCLPAIQAAQAAEDPTVRETAGWALQILAA